MNDDINAYLSLNVSKYEKDIDAIVDNFVGDNVQNIPSPDYVYHYTDDAGLYGILSTGKIWLSDAAGLNDPTEIGHGISRSLALMNQRLGNDPTLYQNLINLTASYQRDAVFQQSGCILVASFSENGDDLSQWRSYADNGRGYAIKFDCRAFEKAFIETKKEKMDRMTFKVLYDDDLLDNCLEEIINRTFTILKLIESKTSDIDFQNDYAVDVIAFFVTSLSLISMCFKNPAYRSEMEYRFMQQMHDPIASIDAKFRRKPYDLVGYLEYDFQKASKDILSNIAVGPAGGVKSYRFANECKRAFRFSNTTVTRSYIPYRA